MTEGKKINNTELHKVGLDDFYLGCTFEACDFSEMTFRNVQFEECVFMRCNLSMTKLYCQLNDVQFVECKIVGTDFSGVGKFSTSFKFLKSNLSYASFIETKLIESCFEECSVIECDFTSADLSRSVFDRCDLSRTIFAETNLERANFETAYGFVINPNINRTNQMVISESELRGLVAHLNIVIK